MNDGTGPAPGKYLYCVASCPAGTRFGAIGFGPTREVYTLRHRDLSAVVSDVPIEVFDPTAENARTHERVISEVHRRFTVIPVSFGQVFRSAEDVGAVLLAGHDHFQQVLRQLDGKVELGLKVFWTKESFLADLEDAHIRKLHAALTAHPGERGLSLELGQRLEQAARVRREQFRGEILTPLRELAVAVRDNTVAIPRMVLNAAFLVAREHEAAFDRRVAELAARYAGRLEFQYSGPWPPHHFVNIRLRVT